jgi:hypothetical protein
MYDMPADLLVEADGPIRIITMNNPDMRNVHRPAPRGHAQRLVPDLP